ncbi:MAG TPA: cupin domain-containing protein [Candidatus Limnocylindrales bacterium]|jgi:quercetin dioxygenase-like cupin family protein
MDVRRFGIGHRRHEGPSGTHGVDGQSIHNDERGVIAELAFRPGAAMAPHSNPNLSYFVVIEGGGFAQVGDERTRVAAGEAVVWPPNVVHAAWTELTPMRAIVVEFAPEPGPVEPLRLAGAAIEVVPPEAAADPAEPVTQPASADGALAHGPVVLPPDRESAEKEPW